MGIGAGGGLHWSPKRGVAGDSLDRSAFAVGPDFKIGYAPTDQYLICYSAKAAFTQAVDYDAVGISGIGFTYMSRPLSPSFFVTGIGGEAGRATIERRDFRDGNGFGVGAGYEFKRHWSISIMCRAWPTVRFGLTARWMLLLSADARAQPADVIVTIPCMPLSGLAPAQDCSSICCA